MVEKKKKQGQKLWQLLFSHQKDEHLSKALCVIPGKLYLCSRCTGMYLAMILFLILLLNYNFLLKQRILDFIFGYSFTTIGVLHWGLEQINILKSNKLIRLFFGFIFGSGLSWIILLNLFDPFSSGVIKKIEWLIFCVVSSFLIIWGKKLK